MGDGKNPPVETPDERERFIRSHASRLDQIVASLRFTEKNNPGAPALMSTADCWRLAKELWDAKPEDC